MRYDIIDCDTHITEPRDVWTARVPERYRDRVPHVVRNDSGVDVWLLDGAQIYTAGITALAGWHSPFPSAPPTYEDMHPAAYDSHARLKLMDGNRIWAQVLYPNVAGFGSQKFLQIKDNALKLVCVEAYNDFLRDWAAADPRRLITIMSMPFWDVDACVNEIARGAAAGHRGILFTGEPQRFGLPFLGEKHWDPLWSAAQDAGLAIHLHIGSGDVGNIFSAERVAAHGSAATYALSSVDLFLKNGLQVSDLLLSGVLPRFPNLRFVSVESGIGWVPFVLEAVDHSYREARPHRTSEWELMPSEYFRRQVYSTHWFETVPLRRLLDDLPIDRLLFETDFPHPTCLYDDVAGRVEEAFGGMDADLRRQLLWGNAAELYGIADPPA
ncbi:MAG TPA: amidohydrolase family protein [Frankiaceae bacterium]|jgi:predicted TIM-barrel fold metal-dependent hydrolase|nr:amidohydrolase family protein [Frankiaceae bacterium]